MSFSKSEFFKHDGKYLKKFYDLVVASENLLLVDKTTLFKFDLKDKNLGVLLNSISSYLDERSEVNASKVLLACGADLNSQGYKKEFKGVSSDGVEMFITINKIDKSNVSQNSQKGEKVASNKDDICEMGVCYALEAQYLGKHFDVYEVPKNSKVIGSVPISDVRQFFVDNPSWKKSCISSASAVLKNIDISNYTIHHKDKIMNSLKTQGYKLSQLAEDKWNPGDFFLIKNTYKLKTYKSWQEINADINKLDEIIPISLKKGENDALHGAYALNNIAKKYNLKSFSSINFKKFDDDYKKYVYEMLKEIQKNADNSILARLDDLNFEKMFKTSQENCTSNNYFKSIPYILEFVRYYVSLKEQQKKDLIYEIVSGCFSRFPESSNFYKVEGNTFKCFDHGLGEVKMDLFVLSLNGDIDLKTNVIVEGKTYKLQCRSKGSLPQFTIVPTPVQVSPKDKPINFIKLPKSIKDLL